MTAATVHTAVYDSANARVQIDLSGFQVGTTGVQVVRTITSSGVARLVRGARNIPITTPASDTVTLFDYEFPAGQEIQYTYYQISDGTQYELAAAATYDVDDVWIKSVLRPYLNLTARVIGYEPFTHDLRVNTFAVVRRNLPVGAGDVRGGRSFALTLRTPDVPSRASLDVLLAVGGTYYLQYPSSNVALPDAGYVMITGAREQHGPGIGSKAVRYWELSCVEVAAPDADLAGSGITWDAVVDLYATWDALVAANPTWNDLVAQVAAPSEVVVT